MFVALSKPYWESPAFLFFGIMPQVQSCKEKYSRAPSNSLSNFGFEPILNYDDLLYYVHSYALHAIDGSVISPSSP
jgi:hypothetical protein